MAGTAAKIILSERQQKMLEEFRKSLTLGKCIVRRATSLQAIERNAPDKPAQPDSVPKQEFEYTRHGTTTLTAGLDVVTGRIVCPTWRRPAPNRSSSSISSGRSIQIPRPNGSSWSIASTPTCPKPW